MFTLNVGFLGCNGERGKEKSKVNFNFPVLQIYGRFIFSFYSDSGFCGRRPGRLDRSVKAFVDFIGSSPARKNKRFCFSLAYSKNSLTVGTPRKLVRHYRSGVQKKQDDTCQSSNGSPTRTPETNKYQNNSTF